MYPVHIEKLQSARIDAANALHDADARCRALFVDGLTTEHDAALKAVNAARFALYDAEQALSAALTAWRREGEDEQPA
jgi:hypothetical protein